METVVLKVEGMSCNHCVSAVESAVAEVGATAKVDLPGKSVTVTYDKRKVSLEKIKQAIEEAGYDVV